MTRWLGLALMVAACDDEAERRPRPQPSTSIQWEIGPVINGKNYSQGLPLRPTLFPDGWGFEISQTAEPHYITRAVSLAGKTTVRMAYRVEGEGTIYGKGCPQSSPSAVTLYFQKAGDNWSSDGGRWWATFATRYLTGPTDEQEIVAPLDGVWTSVRTMTAATHPAEFAAAKRNTARVGFTFANCEGYGHGALATAPMRFVVTKFEILP